MPFLGIDLHAKDYLYQLKFFPFDLKNVLSHIQKVMDQVLASLGFAKYYIN
jgi:hypothetical protein